MQNSCVVSSLLQQNDIYVAFILVGEEREHALMEFCLVHIEVFVFAIPSAWNAFPKNTHIQSSPLL